MIPAYEQLFLEQKIISVEVWEQSQMIGGIYGVKSDRYFSAESMFYKKSNASKAAFVFLVKYLQSQYGFQWMDLQMLTSVSQAMGGHLIKREDFLKRILL